MKHCFYPLSLILVFAVSPCWWTGVTHGFAVSPCWWTGVTHGLETPGYPPELLQPEDSYSFRRLDDRTGLLTVKFHERRGMVSPLTLVVPSDVEFEWKFMGGMASIDARKVSLSPSDDLDLDSIIDERRMWLSDIPIAAFYFHDVTKASVHLSEPTGTVMAELLSSTFELHFSKPLGILSDPLLDLTAAVEDSFAEVIETFIANPGDIPGYRGLPDQYRQPPDESPTTQESPDYLNRSEGYTVRIQTEGSGIVSLTGSALVESGFDIGAKDHAYLKLYHLGLPYPIAVECADPKHLGTNDRIWFQTSPPENHQSPLNTYYLTWSEQIGERVELSDKPPWDAKTTNVRDWNWKTFHAETNNPSLYNFHSDIGGTIDVLWHEFLELDEPLTIDFDLEDLRADRAKLLDNRISVRLITQQKFHGALSMSVRINSATGLLFPLSGASGILEATFSGTLLRPLANRLELVLTGNLGKQSHRYQGPRLDWIEIEYPATPRIPELGIVHGSRVESETRAGPLTAWKPHSSEGEWRVLIQDASPTVEPIGSKISVQEGHLIAPAQGWPDDWWIFDLDKTPPPNSIQPVVSSNLKDNSNQADMLVITIPKFVPLLEQYLRMHQEEGWSCKVVTTQEIYDHFSYGVKEIYAIREYCRHALYNYAKPHPQYLWLVGESRWDPEGELPSPVEDMVPSPIIATRAEPIGNDQWYAYLVGDDSFPDLLVSRVAVSTTPELQAYLSKATQDRNASLGWWRSGNLILVDDNFADGIKHFLARGLDEFIFPSIYAVEDYPLDILRRFEAAGKSGKYARGARADVIEAWSNGTRLVEYVGHGGVTVWSHETLFMGLERHDSDVDRLTNAGRYPLVLVRSCLSGTTNWPIPPGHVSLSEALIKAASRGALAVLGPAGRETATQQENYDTHVRFALFNHRLERLAAIRFYAHCRFLLRSPLKTNIAGTKMLHGDPLLRITLPRRTEIKGCEWQAKEAGPQLALEWDGTVIGTGQMRITSNYETIYESEPFEVTNRKEDKSWILPTAIPFHEKLVAALYIWNDDTGEDAFRGIRLPDFDWNAESPLDRFEMWNPDAAPPKIEVGEIEIMYATPVAGEMIAYSVLLSNSGGQPVQISRAAGVYRISSELVQKKGVPHRSQTNLAPFYLSPGQSRNL